jgi:branched-chain amino acid transport system substrate-binding protein
MRLAIKLFTLILVSLFFLGCDTKQDKEIKIGFVAGLSGKYSSLGISIRDGFLLAFDEINYTIDGKRVTIIQKDDKQDEQEAKKAIKYFINKNIKLVVGNATSSMTKVSFIEVNKQKDMLLISPTASSNYFTKKDDNFLRIQVEQSEKNYNNVISYITKHKYKKIVFIYDSSNIPYAKGYEDIFQKMFVKNGGEKFLAKIDLNQNYDDILKQVKSVESDLILLVSNSIDGANITQYLRYKNIKQTILASGWAKTIDFIQNGGKAVEGVVFSTPYDDNSKDIKFVEFAKKFEEKYNKKPSVFATQGYELGKILIQNLQNSSDIATLKKRILDIEKYSGLQGNIIFDKYGDIKRDYFMMKVIDKSFKKIH